MSTKTGYTQIVKDLPPALKMKESQCEPLHLWTVVRHGTRYPSVKGIKLMTNTLPGLRDKIVAAGKLCHRDLKLLQDWKVYLAESLEKELHDEGEREMMLLGHRWSVRLPDLLQHYEKSRFNLRATRTQRSVASGHSFVTGVWPGVPRADIAWQEPIAGHDPVLRFYKTCRAWVTDVKRNKQAKIERLNFEKSEVMREMLKSLEEDLGVDVNLDEADLMFLMCNFDLAWEPAAIR